VQAEGTITAEGDLIYEWDADWYSAVSSDSVMLTYEMLIPWRCMSLKPGTDTMGVNIVLTSRTPMEIASWARCYKSLYEVSGFNDLTLAGMVETGTAVNLRPQVRFRREGDGNVDMSSVGGGADLMLRNRQAANAVLTVRPDFAEAEPDADEIILEKEVQRYLPEKRVFFQSGLGLLESGVFYSRRIEDIDYGAKVQGQIRWAEYAVLGWKGTGLAKTPEGVFVGTALGVGKSLDGRLVSGLYRRGTLWDEAVALNLRLKVTQSSEIRGKFSVHSEATSAFDEAAAYEVAAAYSEQSVAGMLRYTDVNDEAEPCVGFFREVGFKGLDAYIQKSGRLGGRANSMWRVNASGAHFLDQSGGRYKSGGILSADITPTENIFVWTAAEYVSLVLTGQEYERRAVRTTVSYGRSAGVSLGAILGESFGGDIRIYGVTVFASLRDKLAIDVASLLELDRYDGHWDRTALAVSHLTLRPADWLMVRAFVQYSDLSDSFVANGALVFEPGKLRISVALNHNSPLSSPGDEARDTVSIVALKASYDLPIR
jgi:hypothetical protein